MEVKKEVKMDITPPPIFSLFTTIVFTPSLLSLLHSIDYSLLPSLFYFFTSFYDLLFCRFGFLCG